MRAEGSTHLAKVAIPILDKIRMRESELCILCFRCVLGEWCVISGSWNRVERAHNSWGLGGKWKEKEWKNGIFIYLAKLR